MDWKSNRSNWVWLSLALILVTAACRLTTSVEIIGPVETPEVVKTLRITKTLWVTETPGGAVSGTPTQALAGTATPAATITPTPTPLPNPFLIGQSVEGRPLEIYWFGSGADERLIVAGIHGGYEWNTAALAGELIAHLQAHPELIPEDKTLYILPNLNPDGEARAHGPDGRVNANGVDLNRNFPANWELNYRRSGCWQERPVTAGTTPASEPETQAVIAFVKAHPRLSAAISYHSAALGIFPGGLPPEQASIRLAERLSAVSGYAYPPFDTGCIYTGEMVNWFAMQGMAAVDIELTNHRDTDFEINLKVLEAFLSFEP